MTLRTCLLLSDDPDDHIELREALQEASSSYVIMAVFDPDKAIQLLALKKLVPDLIIVDFTLGGFDSDLFLDTLQSDGLSLTPVVAYGDTTSLSKRSHPRISAFLDDDITYSGLRRKLVEILNGSTR